MTICKKSPWWLAPAFLLALGCGSETKVAKFEVEDGGKAETTKSESNSEFVGKGESEEEPEMTATSSGNEQKMVEQEQDAPKKPSTKKPAAAEEEEEPQEKKVADLKLPAEGSAEDYENFLKEALGTQPTSEAEAKARLKVVGEAAEKILELEKDKESERYKIASDVKSQVSLVAILPLVQAVVEGEGDKKAKAQAELETAVEKYLAPLSDEKASEQMAQTVGRVAQLLMSAPDEGLLKINKSIAEKFAPKFAESENEKLKKVADGLKSMVKMAEGMKRFGELVGNEMELTGKTTESKDFDIKEWKGKVVLVDFWATWCGPCVKEYPNLLKAYNAYHDKGLEIVGVSGDNNVEELNEYISTKKVPWPNLYTEGGHAAMEYYGIMSIPTMILIGRDGKVLSTEARGPELTRLLEEEFAKSEPAAEGEKKEEKPEAKTEEKSEAKEPEKSEPPAKEPEKKDEPKL